VTPSDVDLFVIATKGYLRFAAKLLSSAVRYVSINSRFRFVLLTDDPVAARRLSIQQPRVDLVVVEAPAFGWPEATLLRFHLMSEAWGEIRSETVAYMDADMLFVAPVGVNDLLQPLDDAAADVALVSHPGYFNRNAAYRWICRSALGPWESDLKSASHVPFDSRRTYVCGGMFWGRRDAIKRLIRELGEAVENDRARGIRAKHNDESHLNRWFVDNQTSCVVEPPRWAFDPTYRHLRGLEPIVEAVRKSPRLERLPT
jgi:hypothetical protein